VRRRVRLVGIAPGSMLSTVMGERVGSVAMRFASSRLSWVVLVSGWFSQCLPLEAEMRDEGEKRER